MDLTKNDSIDSVTCQVCSKKVKILNTGHIKSHGMTTEDYLTLYPHATMVCQAYSQLMSENTKARWDRGDMDNRFNDETHRKMREYQGCADVRARKSKTFKKCWEDPEYRHYHSEAVRNAHKQGRYGFCTIRNTDRNCQRHNTSVGQILMNVIGCQRLQSNGGRILHIANL